MTDKTMKHKGLCAVVALAASSALASQYDEPYALVESGYRSVVRKEMPIAISSVDGISVRNPRYSDPIAPGKHRIRVFFSNGRNTTARAMRELDIDLQPCTRYRIVASYQILVHPIWEPKIYVETIGECSAKFQLPARQGQST